MMGFTTIVALSSVFAGALAAPSTSPLAPRNQDSFEATCKHWKGRHLLTKTAPTTHMSSFPPRPKKEPSHSPVPPFADLLV
ncbi:hypothetical protein F5X96DRAFT_663941 [Biscogniauxia mediterranea]|nr:hypothetical protein F5X96DRAFT_663941 [Biscogniauxia mediterranea]